MTNENPIRIGLPRIQAEAGERRAFLPDFVGRLAKKGAQILLEDGYGASLGYSEAAYRSLGNDNIQFARREQVFRQDYVLVLRCPDEASLRLMRPGSCLISMLHYPTRPQRVEMLRSLGIEAISLDSLKDDSGRRLVENLRAVGWNGMEAAFRVLEKIRPDFASPHREAIQVTLLGAGAVAAYVIQAAAVYASPALRQRLFDNGVPGVITHVLDFDTTCSPKLMEPILRETDILVDATQRPDTSQPVIPNSWISWLPEQAVLLDLSVDPYDCEAETTSMKGIEGIPQGNLDQYIFPPDDPAYDRLPRCVTATHRRWALTCYSWPGIYPVECMEHYGRQLRPILTRLLEAGGVQNINPIGRYFERIIGRAMLSRWSVSSV
jgi:alanine dehydrogenase